MKQAERTIGMGCLLNHARPPAAIQHGEATHVGELRKQRLIQRKETAQRDHAGKLPRMPAGHAKRIGSARALPHQEDAIRMDGDAIANPFDRPPDSLVEAHGWRFVRPDAWLQRDEVTEAHPRHHPAEIKRFFSP